MKIVRYLIVNRRGNCRVITRRPLQIDHREEVFQLNITLPEAKLPVISGAVDCTVPDWPAEIATIEYYEAVSEDAAQESE